MKLTNGTSAKEKASREFRSWAFSVARRWGWDTAIAEIAEVASHTKPHQESERIILRYARGVGWPTVLREIASEMEARECYLDVFCNQIKDDEDEGTDNAAPPVDAVRMSVDEPVTVHAREERP